MSEPFHDDLRIVLDLLKTDRVSLAKRLGLAVGALRAWEARGAPLYGRLALAALAAGLDPDAVFGKQTARQASCNDCSDGVNTVTSANRADD